MPLSPEEAHYKGMLDQAVGNNLSSVYVDRNSKGHNYGCKAYHEDISMALESVKKVMQELQEKYK